MIQIQQARNKTTQTEMNLFSMFLLLHKRLITLCKGKNKTLFKIYRLICLFFHKRSLTISKAGSSIETRLCRVWENEAQKLEDMFNFLFMCKGL